jgi:hypothetical protein
LLLLALNAIFRLAENWGDNMGRLVLLALGAAAVFLLGVGVAVANVMHVLNLTPENITDLVKGANQKQLMGDITFALIPFTAIAILNIFRHLLLRGQLIAVDFSFYGLIVLPLIGLLLFFLINVSSVWGEVAHLVHKGNFTPFDGDKIDFVERVLLWNVILLAWYEVLMSTQEEWLSWQT